MTLTPLLAMTKPALIFAGQGSNWQYALSDAASSPLTRSRLSDLLDRARTSTGPVARLLASTVPGTNERLRELIGDGDVTSGTAAGGDVAGDEGVAGDGAREVAAIDAHPAVSVPGIVLGQIAAVEQLRDLGLEINKTALAGHSQGTLGVVAARHPEQALAFALLLGTAASHVHGATDDRPHMLSIRGLFADQVTEILADASDSAASAAPIAVINGPRHVVLSGTPEALQAARSAIEAAAESFNAQLEAAEFGGAEMNPLFDELPVAYPFHGNTAETKEAAELAAQWADECGIDLGEFSAAQLAEDILHNQHDWPAQVSTLLESGVSHIVALDKSIATITSKLTHGSNVAVLTADSASARDKLATPGTELPEAVDYSEFAPRLVRLPDGKTYTQTRFSTVTGLSPIMLGGMTPTSADGEIVAAAANAGYWTELAGGGMYSDEVFTAHKDDMESFMEPGRTAQFNTMFFDRFLWNLHFGQARIVPKARAAGASFNGVCISAGIPEVDEATELLTQLKADGFPYISFKPGTSKQIRDAVKIAAANPDFPVIIQVEDGHAGGHHSWTNLDDMLLDTYAEVRKHPNALLAVGGGIYSPEVAATYITGTWSEKYGLAPMPVDAVFIGTVAMATKEAKATDSVKELLVNTPGIAADDNGGWVARGTGRNGVASSQSHLLADIHDLDNSFAAASRLITAIDIADYKERRDDIIEAINKTSKPYFGDVETMTYAEWVERFVELAHPFVDPTWDDRFFDLLHRVEARLNEADHGEIDTLFPDIDEVADAPAMVTRLLEAYPEAREITVSPRDAAWWISLHYKHVKPMPWVPAIDGDLKTWFGKDTLWQAQDERYDADEVRIIPGPLAVAGITKKNEPVADLLGRFEAGATQALVDAGQEPEEQFSRLADAKDAEEFIKAAPTIVWHGHLMANPAYEMDDDAYDLIQDEQGAWSIRINSDSYWDDLPEDQRPFYVREVTIPLDLSDGVATGASPVVSDERLPDSVFALLQGLAGVGSTSETGDEITEMPQIIEGSQTGPDGDAPFGVAQYSFTLPASLLTAHTNVTGAALASSGSDGKGSDETPVGTPDVLVGPCWPAIYTALGSGQLADGYPVIEGLLNAVHLNHVVDLRVPLHELADGRRIDVISKCTAIDESISGRIVTVELELFSDSSSPGACDGTLVATQMQRFAIRGRATGTAQPTPAPEFGGGKSSTKIEATPRSFMDRTTVTAPSDMTPFALVSGDYNPIHTSYNASGLVNLEAPLVHGMWLSATSQHAAQRAAPQGARIVGWTYSMYGMVQLEDEVEITVERVGRKGIHAALEVTCRIDGEVVSVGQALLAQPKTAYVYPGQGIQTEGMGRGDRDASPAAREIWRRADRHTRESLGFSIQRIIDENPTQIVVKGTTFRHPQGVLHLTQFTQVALAVVAYAQTERLREADALASNSMYAGHSLGEYTALASLANIFDLEAVIDVVYSRGSAMGGLVPRDEEGNSDYGMGALRPNMVGLAPHEVDDYVASVSEKTGEFLQIVNYNIAGQQYSIAGTKKGLSALKADANAINDRAYVTVPGIDVPFHSSVLRDGVPAFAQKLDELLPAEIDIEALESRYVPNLVARPFELTQDFIDAIKAEVPTERLANVTPENTDANTLARTLLIELLAWQFASPVRWIETQDLLLRECDQMIEVGLASSPTLTNLAKREMDVIGHHIPVFNVEANQDQVMLQDVVEAPLVDEPPTESAPADNQASEPASSPAPADNQVQTDIQVQAGSQARELANEPASSSAPDLPFTAADAIMVLFSFQNKMRLEQINDSDTVEELTNGVSSRRNQLLMDMSAEIGVPAIDGAADADVATLREKVKTAAPGYQPFGSVLAEAITARVRQLTGAAGVKPAYIGERVTDTWGLPASWAPRVEAEILMGSRDEESVRGGSLATVPTSASSKADVDALVDAAVQSVASRHGVSVSLAAAGGAGGGGGVVDSAALDAYADDMKDTLVSTARTLLGKLGVDIDVADTSEPADTTVLDTVEAELGSGWVKLVTPVFDARRAVLFDDRWAQAREDLARIALGELTPETPVYKTAHYRYAGTGETVAEQAEWYADNGYENQELLKEIAWAARGKADEEFAGDVALVTGAAPGSIATAVVEKLLGSGATVIMTASNVSQARKEFARRLYLNHASANAKLWVVPANLSSYRDIDALIDWIGSEQRETVGNEVKITKPALTPTLAYPFAAPSVSGSLADAGPAAENQTRLLLWSVERTIAGLSELAQKSDDFPATRAHIVLPGSPNRGMFGGDGAYGEVKAALDAILAKWGAEAGWPAGVTLAQAKIGWVAGTGLMGGNDGLVPAAEKAGIHVWSPEEISSELIGLASKENRAKAAEAPLELDLTGGLGDSPISLPDLAASAKADADNGPDADTTADTSASASSADASASAPGTIKALPNIAHPTQLVDTEVGDVTCDLDDMIVVVGLGEVSSWGLGRTRREAEYGIQRDGDVELTAAGVLELAWMMNLVEWAEDPNPGWYDAEGNVVAEEDIYDRFRDEVVARSGVRTLTDKYFLTDQGSIDATEVFLDRDITFAVANEQEARDIEEADPDKTEIAEVDGEWTVTRKAGATARVPRKATLTRTVAGQMPDDFNPENWGIPAQMIDGLDRIAVWNLVTGVDAFVSAGFTPAELMQAIHPSQVSSTQGTGIGGMESLHKVFVTRFLGEERPSDILQEALPNVVAAHVMQSLVGGYGSMIHPVGACATAAVSVEEAVDKIALGKADFVVAGGIDDVQVESLTGFGDMNATAETKKMTDQGIHDRFISRANDRRRGGFLEAEGGGTVLIARGCLAAELGLPVYAVLGYASSFGDGAHTSIPAPGLGVLAAARGGENSKLAKNLKSLGLTPDDVSVLSKHDTSTNANDPNESELHSILWPAIGRDAKKPMYVISQKTLTGHSKAGAALFQIGGIIDVLRTGVLPQNASLDCVDPLLEPKSKNLVWLRNTLDLGAGNVKAAALTSLGFGHVGALVVLAHPGVFYAALRQQLGEDAADRWREQATQRLRRGAGHLEAGMIGRTELFKQIENRRFAEGHTHDSEIALLLDENARLGKDGTYPIA
ncbi:type I polyketide synthase [Corynebacterium cystitidis]|uniref:type I polyketide synthase n=1 Tax=Corynebacterium cystitidis TaxID=35757 RepID=UPI00211F37E9|nr:type I polyketide synthase [Corynebacterium cystitidis]